MLFDSRIILEFHKLPLVYEFLQRYKLGSLNLTVTVDRPILYTNFQFLFGDDVASYISHNELDTRKLNKS